MIFFEQNLRPVEGETKNDGFLLIDVLLQCYNEVRCVTINENGSDTFVFLGLFVCIKARSIGRMHCIVCLSVPMHVPPSMILVL